MKRIFDIFLSLFLLILLSPIILIIFALVKTKLGSPVIFKQNRPGLNEKIFCMYKFRSMTDQKDVSGNLLSDRERLTPFGRLLRKTSLDELPELWNILKGDMSFVGPRPLLERYLPYYTTREKQRHLVRPGLTGLAQISGRNAISWEQKLNLDVKYVESHSFFLDLKIMALTFFKLFKHSEILDAAPQGPLDKYRQSARKPDQ